MGGGLVGWVIMCDVMGMGWVGLDWGKVYKWMVVHIKCNAIK